MAQTMMQWNVQCVVDTIRHADGRSTVRYVKSCGLGGLHNTFAAATKTKLLAFFKETEALFTPGSIRVTHLGVFYYDGFQSLLEEIGSHAASNPWKRFLLYSHSIQRGQTEKIANMVQVPSLSAPIHPVLCSNGVL